MAKVFCTSGARDMTASREWARQADAGEYLIKYATCGVDESDDTGSLCGYGEEEIAQLGNILDARGLRIEANDVGLIVVGPWSVGDKVEAGEPGTEDYDRGIVHALRDDGLYLVGWESGVSTPHAADELRAR